MMLLRHTIPHVSSVSLATDR
ncbi:unnamed protein product [Linum tenue]|uniref:Uncharacterized protein n=1 Tax=Linum tenue TaxID=586396 RepID=A0AAV0MR28_9ROSI|nr:unnamed protein product [Linum tenue]